MTIAVVGAVVGASALVVSIAGHRHNVRQAERLAERERRIEARKREADQREKLIQSSMRHVALTSTPSVLAEGYAQWRLEVVNTSNQPFTHVTLHYDGERLDSREVLVRRRLDQGNPPHGFPIGFTAFTPSVFRRVHGHVGKTLASAGDRSSSAAGGGRR